LRGCTGSVLRVVPTMGNITQNLPVHADPFSGSFTGFFLALSGTSLYFSKSRSRSSISHHSSLADVPRPLSCGARRVKRRVWRSERKRLLKGRVLTDSHLYPFCWRWRKGVNAVSCCCSAWRVSPRTGSASSIRIPVVRLGGIVGHL